MAQAQRNLPSPIPGKGCHSMQAIGLHLSAQAEVKLLLDG